MAVKVLLSEVLEALELANDEMSSYVNQKTGKVVTVGHEEMRLAERDDPGNLPDWQRELVEEARQVLTSDDWLSLPDKFEIHEWDIMARFGESLTDSAQREQINEAIHGAGAFRMFKSTIRRLGIEQAWYDFKQRAIEDMARDWLEAHELVAKEGPTAPKAK
jgi:hypothetical protein